MSSLRWKKRYYYLFVTELASGFTENNDETEVLH